jgi:hypothetical protein
MDIANLVLKVFSIYLVVSGLFLLFKGKTVPLILKDFMDHPATIYLTGVILIFLSSMYLIQYNVWNHSWQTLVTIFAWLVMVKGLAYIFAPKALSEVSIKKSRGLFGLYGFVAVVIGVYLFFAV